jgi:hypothetical protein
MNIAADPLTMLDIYATSELEATSMFSQFSLPEMNTGHDIIYGSYKICEIDQESIALPHYYCDYGRMDVEQLQSDLMQFMDAIYDKHDLDDLNGVVVSNADC